MKMNDKSRKVDIMNERDEDVSKSCLRSNPG